MCHGDTLKGRSNNMNKVEINKLNKLKEEYIRNKRSADEIFNRPSHEYEKLSESIKRKGDQDYGYANGLYQALAVLGVADDLPKLD